MIRYTPCECDGPGWCARHQCVKSHAFFHRCRRSLEAFNAWEARHGPCMPILTSADADPLADGDADGPGLLRRAMNFGAAIARHAVDQLRNVDDERFDARLAICRECPSCDVSQLVCREQSCGCFLQTKARWASETCPLRKWPVDGETGPTPPDGPVPIESTQPSNEMTLTINGVTN